MRASCFQLAKLVALSVTLATSIPIVGMAQEWGEVTQGEWLQGAPVSYPAANAVVLFDRAEVMVAPYTGFRLTRHIRFKVVNRAGVDELSRYEIVFHKKTDFTEMKAQTIRPDGTTIPVGDDGRFVKKDGNWRHYTFAFPSLDSGCIAEVTYARKESYYIWSYPWYFHNSLFTLESRFSMVTGGRFVYDYHPVNFPSGSTTPTVGTVPSPDTDANLTSYTWRLRNLPPIKEEPFMNCVENYRSALLLTLGSSRAPSKQTEITWDRMGKIFEDYVEEYLSLPRNFRKTIKKQTKGCKTKYDKAKALYSYVVNNFETQQNGYRRVRHHKNLNGLFKEHYGTAWEKNLLLLEMLRKARIDCWPVLICTRDHAKFDPTWKEFDQFSHALIFVEVEQGGIFLDASSKYSAFGTLPPVCRVDVGLLIDGFESELVNVITNEPKSYRLDQTELSLDVDGHATATTTCHMTGYLATEYGMRYESAEPSEFVTDELLPGLTSPPEITEQNCYLDSSGRFIVELQYRIPDYAESVGSSILGVVPVFMFEANPFESEDRFTPIDFNYPQTYHSVVNMKTEDTALLVVEPEAASFGLDGISYRRQGSVSGNQIRVESIINISKLVFGIDEYGAVREMFRRVSEAVAEPVVWSVGQSDE